MTTNPHPTGSPHPPRTRMLRTATLLASSVVAWCGAVGAFGQTTPTTTPPPTQAPPEGVPMAGAPVEEVIAAGSEVEVVLKDGQRQAGLLMERTKVHTVISVNGVVTTHPAETIDRVTRIPTIDERYRMLRDAIDADDVDAIVQLAEWLRGKGRLDLALWEVERALLLEPGNPRGKDLKVEIVAQQKVNEAKRLVPGPDPGPDKPPPFVFPLLNAEQINLMKVYEVDLRDPPSMNVPPDVTRRFLAAYAGRDVEGLGTVPSSPEAKELFLRQRPADLLAWFFAARAREFYGQVRVRENPAAMRAFAREVHNNWLINSCATTKCHGGEEAGRLWLTNQRAGSEPAAYTNFLILERFKTADGKGLIDYDQPERSPLLDYGLPREVAIFKHPEVPGKGKWRPVFQDRDDDRYLRAIDWIKSMYRPRTGYPIEYTPPVPKPQAEAVAPTDR